MQSRIHRVTHLLGEEIRQVFERNRFDTALDETFVSGQTGKPTRRIDTERRALFVGDLRKVVGDRVHVVAAVLGKQPGNPMAATAEADDAKLHFPGERCGGRRRLGVRRGRRAEKRRSRGGGDRASDELSS